MANNTNNPALNNIPRSSPSTTSMNRPSSSNTGLNKPAPSNTLINRERAAGLPSQNYNQHGDAPTSLNELSPVNYMIFFLQEGNISSVFLLLY